MVERLDLLHVHIVTSKGRKYYYHRITRERLSDEPNARALRVLEINASLADVPTEPGRGTWAAGVREYKGSPEFKQLAPLTRRDYVRHLDPISEMWGNLRVRDTQTKHVKKMRDTLADTARKANYRVQVLSLLINHLIETDERIYGRDNPAARVKKLKQGPGYSPWPDNIIAAFAEAAYPELRHVVIGGALGTGQRGQDVIAMSWVHLHDGGMEVTQKKTGERILLPITRELSEAVAEIDKSAAVIFTTKTGRPWNHGHLSHEVADLLADIGFPGYSLHGLRFNAARRLRDAGASWEEIAAVLGHRGTEMARMYATRAEQAKTAVERMERTQHQRTAVKPGVKRLTGSGEKV